MTDGSLTWKKIHVEYLKFMFPILHIPRIHLFFFFLNSFLLPSRSDSFSSCSIWSSALLPFLFFLPNLVLSFGFDLVFCSSILLLLSSRSSSIEIESYRLGFTFYKLESIRLRSNFIFIEIEKEKKRREGYNCLRHATIPQQLNKCFKLKIFPTV